MMLIINEIKSFYEVKVKGRRPSKWVSVKSEQKTTAAL